MIESTVRVCKPARKTVKYSCTVLYKLYNFIVVFKNQSPISSQTIFARVGIQSRAGGGKIVRFTRTQCGFELRNDPTRAETTQPVPEPCGRFGSGPLPTDLAKASEVSLRFRGIYFEL